MVLGCLCFRATPLLLGTTGNAKNKQYGTTGGDVSQLILFGSSFCPSSHNVFFPDSPSAFLMHTPSVFTNPPGFLILQLGRCWALCDGLTVLTSARSTCCLGPCGPPKLLGNSTLHFPAAQGSRWAAVGNMDT